MGLKKKNVPKYFFLNILSPILIKFLSFDSLWNFLLVYYKQIWSNSYSFYIKRSQREPKSNIQNYNFLFQVLFVCSVWFGSLENSCKKCSNRLVVAFTVSRIWEVQKSPICIQIKFKPNSIWSKYPIWKFKKIFFSKSWLDWTQNVYK